MFSEKFGTAFVSSFIHVGAIYVLNLWFLELLCISLPWSWVGSSLTPRGRLCLWTADETADTGARNCDCRHHGTKLLLDCRWLKYERGFLCEKIVIQKRQSGFIMSRLEKFFTKNDAADMLLTQIYFLLIKSLPVLLVLAFILLFEASLALCIRNYHLGLSFLLLMNWFIFSFISCNIWIHM